MPGERRYDYSVRGGGVGVEVLGDFLKDGDAISNSFRGSHIVPAASVG